MYEYVTLCIVSLIDQTWKIYYYIEGEPTFSQRWNIMHNFHFVHRRISVINREFFLLCFMHPFKLCNLYLALQK